MWFHSLWRRLFAFMILAFMFRITEAPFDGVQIFQAGAGQVHAVRARNVTGRHLMSADLELGCLPRCPALGIERDRLACVRAVDAELHSPARTARDRCRVCHNKCGEVIHFPVCVFVFICREKESAKAPLVHGGAAGLSDVVYKPDGSAEK